MKRGWYYRITLGAVAAVLLMSMAPNAIANGLQTPEWAIQEQARGEALFRANDFVGAEAAHRAALSVRTREADPQGWAESIASAGAAQSFRGIRTRDVGALSGAIRDYRLALEVYSREATPELWARTQNNLATALVWLAQVRGDTSIEELAAAEIAFANVLHVTSVEVAPGDAGMVLYNIGTVQERIGDRLTGVEQRARYQEASATYALALDALRRGGRFDYASNVERRVSPFMNRVAAMD
jgi:tetratricopeptide (TPR) repeat protein